MFLQSFVIVDVKFCNCRCNFILKFKKTLCDEDNGNELHFLVHGKTICRNHIILTLTVPVTAIDALRHFETGQ